MVITQLPQTTTYSAECQPDQPIQWRVKTSMLQHLGICQGDELLLEMPGQLQDGCWLLLSFNERYYLRQLSIKEDHFLLIPLAGNQQPIPWPKHQPMPLVGRVVAMHRRIDKDC